MAKIFQNEGHLLVAAIRVLCHLRERSPRPEEVAELLNLPPAVLRVQIAALQEAGVISVVESAFDEHLEIRDHRALETLPAPESAQNLEADLAEFDRRKQQETRKMERLFNEKDHERQQADRHRRMDEELREFHKRKPRDPFAQED